VRLAAIFNVNPRAKENVSEFDFNGMDARLLFNLLNSLCEAMKAFLRLNLNVAE
jgi:hypothetical protein